MSGEAVGLAIVGTTLIGASLAVVLSRNLFHAVLWLALALTATAGVFLLLHAEFLAAVQVLLYAGGVVTIVVFAIMLTERLVGQTVAQMNRGMAGGALLAAAVLGTVAGVIVRSPRAGAPAGRGPGGTAAVGQALLTDWVLAFEVLAVLFVAALLGALYLARTDE